MKTNFDFYFTPDRKITQKVSFISMQKVHTTKRLEENTGKKFYNFRLVKVFWDMVPKA